MKLPLLRTPRVAFELIHNQLNLSDVIQLSKCSKATKKLLRSFEIYQKDTCLRVTVAQSFFNVVVESERRDNFEVFDNQFITRETDLIFWISFLKDLFQCPIGSANFNSENFNFEMLFVENDILHEIDEIHFETRRFSNFQAQFLLDKLITKKLEIVGHIPSDFSYHQARFPKTIYIEQAHWITLDNLADLIKSSVHVVLSWLRFPDKEWNKVIRSWLEGDSKKIRYLSVYWPMPEVPRDFNDGEIFEGIATLPGAKKRSDASRFFDYNVEYDKGYDIRRPDGTLATLFIDCTAHIELFIFTVWDVPNPNLE